MRWTWRDAIRFKDWKKLEEFAKTQPCGQLADTVYELEIGLDEKEDVRAAKKVLYILEQQGITPSQTSGPRLTEYEKPTAGRFGVLSTTDLFGFQYIALVHTCGRKVRVISGTVENGGFCQLNAFEFPFGHLHRLRDKIMLRDDKVRKAYAVSPEYILNRLAWYREHFGFFDPEAKKRGWKEPAYWTKQMDARPDKFPSMTENLHPIALGSIDIEEYWKEHPAMCHWRMPISDMLTRGVMSELRHIETRVTDPQERYERRLEHMMKHRAELIDYNLPFDMEMRFSDLAAFGMLEDDEATAKKCKRMEVELGQRGADSRFFDSLIETTARDLDVSAARFLYDDKHFLFGARAAVA